MRRVSADQAVIDFGPVIDCVCSQVLGKVSQITCIVSAGVGRVIFFAAQYLDLVFQIFFRFHDLIRDSLDIEKPLNTTADQFTKMFEKYRPHVLVEAVFAGTAEAE